MKRMSPFRKLISYEEAKKIVLENVKPVEQTEEISIDEAYERVLAEDLTAKISVPPFDRAAMDGYAVKAEDTYGASRFKPKKLKLLGAAYPGKPFNGKVGRGECVQIATGCPMPAGANAVVMVENTQEREGFVEIYKPVYPIANVAPKGEDIEKGDKILKAGTYLTPPKIGVLAALGEKTVKVYVKPNVSIISTGTEIKEVGSKIEEGEIYDINSHTLSAVVMANGGSPVRYGIIPDSYEELKLGIKKSLKNDLIVLSGGSSVGTQDLLYNIIEELGEVLFHGVQVKPGKPTLFGLIQGKPVLGMPGYPTSCLSNAYLFLAPAVRKMARIPEREPKKVKVKMGHRFASSSGRAQFLTVKIRDGKAYQAFKESGAITSMSEADGYILVPVNADVIEEGEEVAVTLLE